MNNLAFFFFSLLFSISAYSNSNVGFFYFGHYQVLDPQAVQGVYVRTSISWGDFEPSSGVFNWNNEQAVKQQDLLRRGFRVIPSIRAKFEKQKDNWATEDPKGKKCATAPLDLDFRTRLREGRSYSVNYYNFVKKIARQYKGIFDTVVIENEMNDQDDFWCPSIDAYLRVFLTAKKAFADVDPRVRLSDGGLQGALLVRMIVNHYIDRNEVDAAVRFYARSVGQVLTRKDLKANALRWRNTEIYKRSMELYESDLYSWTNVVNFHHYQMSENLPEVVAFLRRRVVSRKQIMTNEMGIKQEYAENPDLAAQELVKKYARLISLGVGPSLWFSSDGDDDNNQGAFVRAGGVIVPETTDAFEATASFLSRSARHTSDLSSDTETRLKFIYRSRNVTVLWTGSGLSLKFKPECSVYDYRGRPTYSGPGPFFQVCE